MAPPSPGVGGGHTTWGWARPANARPGSIGSGPCRPMAERGTSLVAGSQSVPREAASPPPWTRPISGEMAATSLWAGAPPALLGRPSPPATRAAARSALLRPSRVCAPRGRLRSRAGGVGRAAPSLRGELRGGCVAGESQRSGLPVSSLPACALRSASPGNGAGHRVPVVVSIWGRGSAAWI